MARRKSPTSHTDTYTLALEHLHLQHATYLMNFDFDTAMGAEIRKSEIARVALLYETRSTIGQDDKMVSFFEDLQRRDNLAERQQTVRHTMEAMDADATVVDTTETDGDIRGTSVAGEQPRSASSSAKP